MFDPRKVAENEIGCYKEHHSRNYDAVTKRMTRVYEMLFGLSPEITEKIVLPKIEAWKEHDLAERKGISRKESQQHWNKALEFMTQHFEMLSEATANENFREYVSAVVQTKRGQV